MLGIYNNSRRLAAAKAAVQIRNTFQKRSVYKTKNLELHVTNVSNASNQMKNLPAKKRIKPLKVVINQWSNDEVQGRDEKDEKSKQREEHLKRRASRMIHSSNKLYISGRLASIINFSSPQSPIECINLSSQFSDSNATIVEITTYKKIPLSCSSNISCVGREKDL
jgi:hypothetical protein